MQVEAETTVARPPGEVFDYLAHAEYLPEYVVDFESVEQVGEGEPRLGTKYSYRMKRGDTDGSFEWTRFEPTGHLEWRGPRVKPGPGSMEPAGWWEISPAGEGTRIKLVMAPSPGGLFKVLAPFLSAGMRKGNEQALERLKQKLESRPG